MPAFDPSTQMFSPQSPGFAPQNPSSVPGLGNLDPALLARLRALLAAQQSGSPEQANVLRQQLLSVPGVREKLMQLQSPQNANVQPVSAPPAAQPASFGVEAPLQPNPSSYGPGVPASPPLSAPIPPPVAGDPSAPPAGIPNPSPGRAKHGRGLPPGQAKRKPSQGRFGMQNQAPDRPQGGMTAAIPPGLQSPPMSGGGFVDYRRQRMGGGGYGAGQGIGASYGRESALRY